MSPEPFSGCLEAAGSADGEAVREVVAERAAAKARLCLLFENVRLDGEGGLTRAS